MEKKRDQIDVAKEQGYDSIEEMEFGEWCKEAKEVRLLVDYVHHPPAFKLSERVSIKYSKQMKTKVKEVDLFLLHPHEYTTDYCIIIDLHNWSRAGMPTDPKMVVSNGSMYIDVKGGFSPYHDAKQFAINQKWVMSKYEVYINKVVPDEWFRKTFVPQIATVTWKTGKIRDKYRGCHTKDSIAHQLG
jgi:hypothetical protein